METASLCLLSVSEKLATETVAVAVLSLPSGRRLFQFRESRRHDARARNLAGIWAATSLLKRFPKPVTVRITTNNDLVAKLMIEASASGKVKGSYGDHCGEFAKLAAKHRLVITFATGDEMGDEGRIAYDAGVKRLAVALKRTEAPPEFLSSETVADIKDLTEYYV